MKNGTCPKCSQNTVHMSKGGLKYHSAGAIYVQNLKGVFVEPVKNYTDYVCVTCGYYETYISDDMKLEEISREWSKV